MKSVSLGRYIPGTSFVHKLDPRTKIIGLILLMITIFIPTITWELYLGITVIILALLKIVGISFKSQLKLLSKMWIMIVFLLIINYFMYQSSPRILFQYGIIKITDMMFIQTGEIFLRLFLMISASSILTASTKPLDLTFGFEYLLYPLNFIKISSHEIAMIITIALRFIPVVMDEANKIIKAQACRGVDLENGTIIVKIRGMVALIVPLFVMAIDHSIQLGDSMEARGYDPTAKRTRYRQFHFRLADLISIIFLVGLLVATIILRNYNYDFYGKLWELWQPTN